MFLFAETFLQKETITPLIKELFPCAMYPFFPTRITPIGGGPPSIPGARDTDTDYKLFPGARSRRQ